MVGENSNDLVMGQGSFFMQYQFKSLATKKRNFGHWVRFSVLLDRHATGIPTTPIAGGRRAEHQFLSVWERCNRPVP